MLMRRRHFLLGSSAIGLGLAFGEAAYAQNTSSPVQKRLAYVLGNARYGAIGCNQNHCSLRSPESDAGDVASFLELCGFTVVLQKNLPQAKLSDAVSKFSREAALYDVALFYYSGHAIQVDGQNYLIPVDLTDISIATIDEQLVPLDRVLNADAGPDTIGIIILDACRENPFVSALSNDALDGSQDEQIKKGLAPVELRDRFIIAYSTAADQVAADGDGIGLSPFTKAWLTFAKENGADIQDTFNRASTSVCDMSTAGAEPGAPARKDVFCQRPALYSSLGVVPIYWKDEDASVLPQSGPLLVSTKMGDAKDPLVQKLLGNINQEFAFNYVWRPAVAGRVDAEIIPDLDYFQTAATRGRPFVIASHDGYYSPEEGATGWSLSYPILDLIARKIQREPLAIKELLIESSRSRPDTAPYVDLETPGTGICILTIINNSWDLVSKVELAFDIVKAGALSDEELMDYVDNKGDGEYQVSYVAKNIKRYEDFDLREAIRPYFPDLQYFEYFEKISIYDDEDGKTHISDIASGKDLKSIPKKYMDWYKSHKQALNGTSENADDDYLLNIAGRMTSWNTKGESQRTDFAARLSLTLPGVGGGALEYNLHEVIKLPIDGQDHAIHRPVGKTLTKAGDVFRGVFALVPEKSSFHRLRFSLLGESGMLYQSPWVNTHVVVSRNDKEAVLAFR